MPDLLSIERRGEVALVTLRRPQKRNALSIELRAELADAFGALSADEGTGCVVLTGAGSAFCSGMDTSQFGGDRGNRERLVETSTVAFQAVGGCHRPVVAAVNGPALAGGFALSLLCDLRIATHAATFGYPELPRGIPPSYAAARAVLPATVAQELCLTGRIVRATEAQRLGIVREVVSGDVVPRALELAERIASLPRKAILETKRRTLLERRHLWGFLFEEEERVFRRALLGEESGRRGVLGDRRDSDRAAARRRSPRSPPRSGSGPRSPTVATVAASRSPHSSRRLAIVHAASGRNSATSSGTACGSTVSTSSPGESPSWLASCAPVRPSAYVWVTSEKPVTSTTHPSAIGRAFSCTQRDRPERC